MAHKDCSSKFRSKHSTVFTTKITGTVFKRVLRLIFPSDNPALSSPTSVTYILASSWPVIIFGYNLDICTIVPATPYAYL